MLLGKIDDACSTRMLKRTSDGLNLPEPIKSPSCLEKRDEIFDRCKMFVLIVCAASLWQHSVMR